MVLRKTVKKILRTLSANGYEPLNHIELDRERVLHNFKLIQNQHSGFEVMPVLKGNAYGHGIAEMAEILNGADCHLLAVDGYFEAASIRDITKHRILVMGYILPANVKLLDVNRCSFVVQDIAGLAAFASLKKSVRIHLELNTGMNRLGLQPAELPTYLKTLKKYPNLELEGVMTHLADADNELDESFTQKQVATFDRQVEEIVSAGFQPKLIHIAQTAGSAKAQSKYANALRLGIGLYGINPLGTEDVKAETLEGLEQVLELKSTIIKVLDLKKGDKVSYNCTFTAPAPMRIGVLPLGFYEGLPRQLSNKGCATTGSSKPLLIVGRVCMNHTMIDLGSSSLAVGDEVTLISKNVSRSNSIAQLQARHALFPYSLLTGLSDSVRRTIV